MTRLLFDSRSRLRNGWWILLFVALIAATRFLFRPLTHGLRELGIADPALEVVPFLLVLLATWICTRLRREPLASVGLSWDRRWLGESAVGLALGLGSLALVVALIATTGGLRLELDPARSVAQLALGFYVFLCVALFEEALFRGFLFQRLVAGLGAWPALLLLGVLFALGHGENPGMEGATRVWATLELALAAVLLGLAYLKTRSLALPVGLHLGWNWGMGHILGFGVSGYDFAGWLRPRYGDGPQWITGGSFGPEASVFAVVVDLALIALLLRWKGRPVGGRASARPDTISGWTRQTGSSAGAVGSATS